MLPSAALSRVAVIAICPATAAGAAVLTRVRAASQELREAQKAALQAESPEVRIGSSPAAMLSLVPLAIAALRKKAPQTRAVLTEQGVAALWDGLDGGDFDAIVTRLPNLSQGRRMPQELVLSKVGKEKMVLACARNHPLAKRRVSPAVLAACDWAMPPPDALAVLMLNEWFAQAGVRPPVPQVICGSSYASLQVVARSDLLTIVPESAALALQASLKLKLVPCGQGYLDIVFACRSSSLQNPAIRELRACFREYPN